MTNSWANFFRLIVLILGIIVVSFDALLYNFCEKQNTELNAIKDKQDVEAEFNSNKFKYQEDQIERVSKGLEDAQQQIKDQKDVLAEQKEAFLQEVEKRQEVANENKSIQTSLVDIEAETDAIKQDMKSWQKDYVSVLAELTKKMDDSQDEMKSFENNLTALNIPELKDNIKSLQADIEKNSHPVDNDLVSAPPTPEKK